MSSRDRRKAERLEIALPVDIRFLPDGTPIRGSAIEMGPNGMRLMTALPLVEASYIHISFADASNDTYCEGRVVWTQRSSEADKFESGIDIQRWGGGVPDTNALRTIAPEARPKKDRRKSPR